MFRLPVRLLCLLAATAAVAGAPAQMAPWAAWSTIATAHYRIHYPPALADWAAELAGRIEAIHEQVTAQVGYQSPGPIQVLLEDPVAEGNGLAVPLLTLPYVVLWRTEPPSDSPPGNAMSTWTEILLAHELTHIHHLTRPAKPPEEFGATASLFRLPLGPLALKAPRWVSEGYAVLLEGRVTGSGRPHSTLRAAVLRQWARAGKLPPYSALDRTHGFMAGNMAYLVGSAYLEWLERQRPDQPDVLQRLWKQLASRRGRSFEAAFQSTFGFTARDGYQRFQAEITHDALESETRLRAQGLREGSLWLRVNGGVSDLGVSKDGKALLARLIIRRHAGLRVWSLAPPPAPAPRAADAAAQADPFNGVADVPPEYPAPRLLASLPSLDHQAPEEPQWVDDRTVRFQLKRPDREGILRLRPALWRLDFGVRLHPGSAGVPAHPVLAPRHRQGRWVLAWDGQPVPLPGSAVGRAWVDPDRRVVYAGCEVEGIWNLVRVPYQEAGGVRQFGPAQVLTRTPGAAWNPAPTPDGRWLFYTSLDPRGVEIRKLDLGLPPLEQGPAAEPRILVPDAALPSPPLPSPLPPPTAPPPPAPYRARDNVWNHLAAGVNLTPAGNTYLLGAGGSDLLGRLSWQALAGLGDGAGPRGAVLALSSAAWAWKPSFTLFSDLERPSLQRYAPVPVDRQRWGGEWALAWDQPGEVRFWASPVAAWEQVRPRSPAPPAATPVGRGLVGLRAGLDVLKARGAWGLDLAPAVKVFQGNRQTPGAPHAWQALRASVDLRVETPLVPLHLGGEQGGMRGNPQEVFSLGGVTTSLVPESLDLGRIEQPALPAFTATGDRFQRWRFDLGGPVRAYAEGAALWTAGQDRGPWQRVLGLELNLDGLDQEASDKALKRVRVRAGVHRPLDGAMRHRTVATLTLMLRP
ncbi:MAG: hypothetical protein ABSH53_12920 [Holophaga sp.]|jgi:hypothetical protein